MKLFTCNDHKGYWPVGTASVIIAESQGEAHALLYDDLSRKGLKDNDFTLTEIDLNNRQVIVLQDGDY